MHRYIYRLLQLFAKPATKFGRELQQVPTKNIGFTTRFFGGETKVKVTEDAVVTVWAWPDTDDFLRFIEEEIMPYENEIL